MNKLSEKQIAIKNALELLGLDFKASKEDIKKSFITLYKVNLNGLIGGDDTIIRALNNAKEILQGYDSDFAKCETCVKVKFTFIDLAAITDKFNNLMMLVSKLNIDNVKEMVKFELIGRWLWVSGSTYEIKDCLKETGFMFSGSKKSWYYTDTPIKGKFISNYKTLSDVRNRYAGKSYDSDSIKRIA